MSGSTFDRECEEIALANLESVRLAAVNAAKQLSEKHQELEEQITEARAEIFGAAVGKTSAGGFARAILEIASRVVAQAERAICEGELELERFVAMINAR